MKEKNVEIADYEGNTYTGYAIQYIYAEDNTPEEIESLIFTNLVRKSDNYKYPYLVEFTTKEIKSIKEVNEGQAKCHEKEK